MVQLLCRLQFYMKETEDILEMPFQLRQCPISPPQEGLPSHAVISGREVHPMLVPPHVFRVLMDQLSRALSASPFSKYKHVKTALRKKK